MGRTKIKTGTKKKEQLDPNNDEFVSKTMSVMDWAYDRRRPIGIVLLAALLIALGFIGGDHFIESARAEASATLAEGFEAAQAPVVEEAGEVPAPKNGEDDALTFSSFEARATEAVRRFEVAVDKSDSDTAQLALLGRAGAYYDLGEYDKAIADYESFLKGDVPNLLRVGALESLALALEAKGDVDGAKAKLASLLEDDSASTANVARYHTGRFLEREGDEDGAAEQYKALLDTYDEGYKPSRFDYLLVHARTRLLAIDPDAETPELPPSLTGGPEGIDPRLLRQLMQAQNQSPTGGLR